MVHYKRFWMTAAAAAVTIAAQASTAFGEQAVHATPAELPGGLQTLRSALTPEVYADAAARAQSLDTIEIDAIGQEATLTLRFSGVPRYAAYITEDGADFVMELHQAYVAEGLQKTVIDGRTLLSEVIIEPSVASPQLMTRLRVGLTTRCDFSAFSANDTLIVTLTPEANATGDDSAIAEAAADLKASLKREHALLSTSVANAVEFSRRATVEATGNQQRFAKALVVAAQQIESAKVALLQAKFAESNASNTGALELDVQHQSMALDEAAKSFRSSTIGFTQDRQNVIRELNARAQGTAARIASELATLESIQPTLVRDLPKLRVVVDDRRAETDAALDATLAQLTDLVQAFHTTLARQLAAVEEHRAGASALALNMDAGAPLDAFDRAMAAVEEGRSAPNAAEAFTSALKEVPAKATDISLVSMAPVAALGDDIDGNTPPAKRDEPAENSITAAARQLEMRSLRADEADVRQAERDGLIVLAQAQITEAGEMEPEENVSAPARLTIEDTINVSNKPKFNLYNADLPADQDPLRQLVNIDFRGMDIGNVVQLLAQKAQINVISDEQLTGAINANLQEVPLGRAIEIVLRMKNFGIVEEEGVYRITTWEEAVATRRATKLIPLKNANAGEVQVTLENVVQGSATNGLVTFSANEATNTIIISGPRDMVDEFETLIQNLDVSEPVIPTITVAIKLNYAEPVELVPIIQPLLSDSGNVTSDNRSRHVIVTDLPVKVEDIKALIESIDLPVKQVSIEAMIVDALLADNAQTGIDWLLNAVKKTNSNGVIPGNLQGFDSQSDFTTGPVTPGVVNPLNLGGQLAFQILTGDINLRAAIGGEVQSDNAELLANPVIVTVENKPARISIAEEIPYQELTQSTTGPPIATTEFKEVGTVLEVTPRVTHDDHIIVDIDAKQSDTKGESVTGVPPEDKREATTTLRIRNGQTIFIGGLRRFDDEATERKVPIVGDIPVLGLLFKNQNVKKENLELLIFLTCHVMSDEMPELSPSQKERYDQLGGTPRMPNATRDLVQGAATPSRDPFYKWRRNK